MRSARALLSILALLVLSAASPSPVASSSWPSSSPRGASLRSQDEHLEKKVGQNEQPDAAKRTPMIESPPPDVAAQTGEHQTEDREAKARNVADYLPSATTTVAIVGILIGISGVYYGRRSAIETKGNADTIKAVERPILRMGDVGLFNLEPPDNDSGVVFITTDDPDVTYVRYEIRNHGNGPAVVVETALHILFAVSLPTKPPYQYTSRLKGTVIEKESVRAWKEAYPEKVRPELAHAVETGRIGLFFYVRVRCRDVFNDPHTLSFAYRYQPGVGFVPIDLPDYSN